MRRFKAVRVGVGVGVWTGIKREKKDVDDRTKPFKGKEGCSMPTGITGNAAKNPAGVSGCAYFVAHFYPGDGKEQQVKDAGGKKT